MLSTLLPLSAFSFRNSLFSFSCCCPGPFSSPEPNPPNRGLTQGESAALEIFDLHNPNPPRKEETFVCRAEGNGCLLSVAWLARWRQEALIIDVFWLGRRPALRMTLGIPALLIQTKILRPGSAEHLHLVSFYSQDSKWRSLSQSQQFHALHPSPMLLSSASRHGKQRRRVVTASFGTPNGPYALHGNGKEPRKVSIPAEVELIRNQSQGRNPRSPVSFPILFLSNIPYFFCITPLLTGGV